MRVLVIGANGKTGFLTVKELKSDGKHEAYAMVRSEDQKERFENLGVKTVLCDLEESITPALKDMDAVIFAAGSGSSTGKDKTVIIDQLGGIKAAVEAATEGAKRFIMLSAMNTKTDSESAIKHYHRAKAHCDNFIMNMHEIMDETLDWTIVCPGRLTDEAATGLVEVDTNIDGKANTSREHVAKAMVACLDKPNTIRKRFALKEGEKNLHESLDSL